MCLSSSIWLISLSLTLSNLSMFLYRFCYTKFYRLQISQSIPISEIQ